MEHTTVNFQGKIEPEEDLGDIISVFLEGGKYPISREKVRTILLHE